MKEGKKRKEESKEKKKERTNWPFATFSLRNTLEGNPFILQRKVKSRDIKWPPIDEWQNAREGAELGIERKRNGTTALLALLISARGLHGSEPLSSQGHRAQTWPQCIEGNFRFQVTRPDTVFLSSLTWLSNPTCLKLTLSFKTKLSFQPFLFRPHYPNL